MKKLVCIITAVFIALSVIKFPVCAETLALSKTSIDLPVDYFTTISVSGAKENVEWFSGNKSVAAVEPRDGISADIIGIGEGETYIYAKADGETLKCRVTVKQAFIAVSNKAPELCTGETTTIQLAVSGSRKIAMKNGNKEVCSASWGKWDNGMISLTVTASAEGVSKITVYIKEHASAAAETITVKVIGDEIISLEGDSDKDRKVSPIKDVFPIGQRTADTYKSLCAEMDKIIEAYPYKCAVLVESKENGRLFSYNTDEYMPGGCTIKVPYVYYCCTQLEQGNHSLDEKVAYQSKHKVGGSGIIQFEQYGKEYTIAELIDLALRISDNAAYYMLVDVFGKQGFNRTVQDWGYSSLLYSSNYPNVNAEFLNRAMLKMQEKKESSPHKSWAAAWDALLKGISTSDIRKVIDGNVAIKCGVPSSLYYNEVCFIEGESPYTLVIMSKAETCDGDAEFFKSVAQCADKINAAYKPA